VPPNLSILPSTGDGRSPALFGATKERIFKMRWLGIVMATLGFFAVVVNLVLGIPSLTPLLVWGGVGIVGVIIVVNNRKEE
jgi:hypothetical protein